LAGNDGLNKIADQVGNDDGLVGNDEVVGHDGLMICRMKGVW